MPAFSKRKSTDTARAKSPTLTELGYTELEQRRVLAVGAFDGSTGLLLVELVGDEVFELGHDGTSVTFNGDTDIDPTAGGAQEVAIGDINRILIRGEDAFQQRVFLDSDFTDDAGTNLGVLDVFDVDQITLRGNYETNGRITLQADDLINNAEGTSAAAGTLLDLRAEIVNFGNQNGDFISSNTLEFATSDGRIELDSDIALHGRLRAGDIWLVSTGSIIDTPDTILDVVNETRLDAERVVLGNTDLNSVSSGVFNFNTTGNTNINAISDIQLVGNNSANGLTLTTDGIISDDGATTNVVGRTNLFGSTVTLGEAEGETFATRTLMFDSPGDVEVVNQNDTHLAFGNRAANLDLTSTGHINDEVGTTIDIVGNAKFTANSATVGTVGTLDSNTLTFQTTGDSIFHTADELRLAGNNFALNATITSDGDIVDNDMARIDVMERATFDGESILLGDTLDDTFNAGELNFTAGTTASFTENSTLFLVGDNSANQVTIRSTNNVADEAGATLNAEQSLFVRAINNINLGTQEGNQIFTNQVTANAVNGNSRLGFDTDVVFINSSSAGDSMNVSSTGSIRDSATAEIIAENDLVFNGVEITLGDQEEDCLLSQNGEIRIFATVENVTPGCAA